MKNLLAIILLAPTVMQASQQDPFASQPESAATQLLVENLTTHDGSSGRNSGSFEDLSDEVTLLMNQHLQLEGMEFTGTLRISGTPVAIKSLAEYDTKKLAHFMNINHGIKTPKLTPHDLCVEVIFSSPKVSDWRNHPAGHGESIVSQLPLKLLALISRKQTLIFKTATSADETPFAVRADVTLPEDEIKKLHEILDKASASTSTCAAAFSQFVENISE